MSAYWDKVKKICKDPNYHIDPVEGRIFLNGKETALSGKKYAQFGYEGITLNRSHVIFFYVHGIRSSHKINIDHSDRDKKNDKISNLRLLPPSDNGRNKAGRTKYRGGFYDKVEGKWVFRLTIGSFDDPEVGSAAYAKAFKLIHPGVNNDFD